MAKQVLVYLFSLTIFIISCSALSAGSSPLTSESIVFQAFFWNVPAGGIWYDTIAEEAPGLKTAGFTHFWFPPPTKGAVGKNSMGYDLYDNYDLGNYYQKGTVETRFGSLAELQNAAEACGNVLLDLVANHMTGSDIQVQDPNDGKMYWQNFQYVHNRFWKSAKDFHPGYPDNCDLCDGNDYLMFEDVCHNSPYMFNGQLEWAKWMKDTIGNVAGFRLDAVKYYSRDMSKAFGNVGSCIGEFWDSGDKILRWINDTGNYAFDFPLYYSLHGNAAALDSAGLSSDKAVSFVRNHDTDEVSQKSRAYGFILYISHIPTVFWSDWFDTALQPDINRALQARRTYDFRGTSTIYKTDDLIIFRNNTPVFGCFNSSSGELGGDVQAVPDSTYSAIAWGPGSQPPDVNSDEYGNVNFTAPAQGYCYWYRDPEKNSCKNNYHNEQIPGNYRKIYFPVICCIVISIMLITVLYMIRYLRK